MSLDSVSARIYILQEPLVLGTVPRCHCSRSIILYMQSLCDRTFMIGMSESILCPLQMSGSREKLIEAAASDSPDDFLQLMRAHVRMILTLSIISIYSRVRN